MRVVYIKANWVVYEATRSRIKAGKSLINVTAVREKSSWKIDSRNRAFPLFTEIKIARVHAWWIKKLSLHYSKVRKNVFIVCAMNNTYQTRVKVCYLIVNEIGYVYLIKYFTSMFARRLKYPESQGPMWTLFNLYLIKTKKKTIVFRRPFVKRSKVTFILSPTVYPLDSRAKPNTNFSGKTSLLTPPFHAEDKQLAQTWEFPAHPHFVSPRNLLVAQK